ncbi:uncharacterized protein UTRI_10477 [Ustilago trichophora]|uniref:N-acetyltransferase domain-containing protein n=1 Tax=Ustilago trichophora TaxID=86804 RepID=A0A5C3EAY9_9BASI|nr:uncharacterized protein UTRI_10477 [Ustilago trichophora]
MSTNSSAAFGDAAVQNWPNFLNPSAPPPAIESSSGNILSLLSTPSPSSASTPSDKNKDGDRHIANLLALTELRKAAWARIYLSGISTGDAAISTTCVPTWRQFDSLMIRRHRHIAVDPRDNRTLGWIACFHPFPLLSPLYDDAQDSNFDDNKDGRGGRLAEIQIMVAQAERNRGVGTFLVKAILASFKADRRYSTVQACFFPENQACQKLFDKCGFEIVATRKHAIRMIDGPTKGTWRDLVTVEIKLPPLTLPSSPPPPTQQQQQQQQQQHEQHSIGMPTAIDMTIDPHTILKRPRLD